jgi:hypothetical protein
VEFQKNFYVGNLHIAPSLNANYTKNLSQSLVLSTLPEITKSQRPEVFTQEFDFYTAELFKIGCNFQFAYVPDFIKNLSEINFCIILDYWKPLAVDSDMTDFCVKAGFVF